MRYLVTTVLLAVLVTACKKAENRRCWKSTGDETTVEIPVDDFDRLMLHGHISYVLIQDSLDKVVITGGKNLVNFIECTVSGDGLLEIKNNNKCAFLRSGKKELIAEIHCTSVSNIRYEGTEYLKSVGTIHSPYFALLVRDGAGPVDLTLNSIVIDADISHGWGDYTLRGTVAYAKIGARSNGYCDVFGLQITDSVYVASETPGNIKVNANGIPLRGYIKNSGDVWYKGVPSLIDVYRTGEGEVLNKN
jgi:hypothetical protein